MRQSALPLIRFDAASGPICLGHLLSGIHNGPTLVVLVSTDTGSVLISALSGVPRIANIRGRIAVVYREQLDLLGAKGTQFLDDIIGPVDDWYALADVSYDDANLAAQKRRGLTWDVLSRAANLGMISGRGIIQQPEPAMYQVNSERGFEGTAMLH